jgi:hypothetical protein
MLADRGRIGGRLARLREAKESVREAELPQIADPRGIQHAIEVIDLVLHHARMETIDLAVERLRRPLKADGSARVAPEKPAAAVQLFPVPAPHAFKAQLAETRLSNKTRVLCEYSPDVKAIVSGNPARPQQALHMPLAIIASVLAGMVGAVGMAAAMLGMAGYEASLAYARQRPQGRPVAGAGASAQAASAGAAAKVVKDATQPQVPIIEHADVKRMLLAQKAYCEGALALELYCARLVDEQHTGGEAASREAALLLEVLTPIAKSWPSEWCLEANSLAIQVHGGYGYTRDFPVE